MNNIHITKTEREILEILIQGKSKTQIAEEMFISYATVSTHFVNLYNKFNVNADNRADYGILSLRLALKYLKMQGKLK